MIYSLQYLRFVAAAFVVLTHGRGEFSIEPLGAFGVDIFFVLSGFIIYFVTQKDSTNFLLKRIIRIVPLYWSATLGLAILVYFLPQYFKAATFDLKLLFHSFLFWPIWTESNLFSPILRLGWTLNYEMMFYFLFWISMLVSHQYRHWIATIILLSLGALEGQFSNSTALGFYANGIIFEFIFGIWIAHLYFKKPFKLKLNRPYIGLFFLLSPLLLVVVQQYIPFSSLNSNIHRASIFGLSSALIFIMVLSLEDWFALLPQKAKNIVDWLGNLSYSMYLLHIYILGLLYRALKIQEPTMFIIINIFVIILLSHLCFSLIEKPSRDYLRSKWLKK